MECKTTTFTKRSSLPRVRPSTKVCHGLRIGFWRRFSLYLLILSSYIQAPCFFLRLYLPNYFTPPDCLRRIAGRRKLSLLHVDVKRISKQLRPQVLHEVSILYNLSHPNIQRFVNWYETPKHLWVIVEHCAGGSLDAILRSDMRLPEQSALVFAAGVLRALHYLHHRGVVGVSLYPCNILLDESGELYLRLFGFI